MYNFKNLKKSPLNCRLYFKLCAPYFPAIGVNERGLHSLQSCKNKKARPLLNTQTKKKTETEKLTIMNLWCFSYTILNIYYNNFILYYAFKTASNRTLIIILINRPRNIVPKFIFRTDISVIIFNNHCEIYISNNTKIIFPWYFIVFKILSISAQPYQEFPFNRHKY